MVAHVEEFLQIHVDYPDIALIGLAHDLENCVVRAPRRSKAEARHREDGVIAVVESFCATACCTKRSTTIGLPRFLNFPLSGFGIPTRFLGAGRYFPDRIALISSPRCWQMYFRRSSVFIPSTPAALIDLDAFKREQHVLVAQYSLECDLRKCGLGLCSVFYSITVVAPSRAPISIPWIPKLKQVLRFVRHATLCQSYKFSLSAGAALSTMISADSSRQALLRVLF